MATTLLDPAGLAGPVPAVEFSRTAPRIVVHLIASNFFGGPEKQIIEHCTRLDPERWRAVVGSFREGRPRVEVEEAARVRGLPTFLIDTVSPFSPGGPVEVARQVRRHGADILVAHGYKSTAVGYLARKLRRVPVLPFVRGYTAETARVRLYEKLDRLLLRRAFPRVVCVSETTRRLLIRHGVHPERIVTIHNAVEVEEGVVPANLRDEFRIPPGIPVLVAAGRLSVEKGHRYLIEALRRMPAETVPHLMLLGEGRERDRLRELARALDVSHRVHFAGFHSNPYPFFAAADLVVNPSLTEGLPNVVLEAQALGVPVVATDVGGVGELVLHEETGWLVEAGNPDALARTILTALADPSRARLIAKAARERVREFFSFAGQAERLMALYDEAIGR
jgi:glycosyltransferase involved in cell wall biosynthesis